MKPPAPDWMRHHAYGRLVPANDDDRLTWRGVIGLAALSAGLWGAVAMAFVAMGGV